MQGLWPNRVFVTLPDLDTEDGQRALMYSADLTSAFQQSIKFGGASRQFAQLFVQKAAVDEGGALIAVLDAAKEFVRPDRRAECDTLIEQVWAEQTH